MRSLNVTFEDKDYAKLEKEKGDLGWREFILTLTSKEKKGDTDAQNNSEP